MVSKEQSEKAMLKRKTKCIKNMDKFSSRKNAYKNGWQDCFDWMISMLPNENKGGGDE